MERFVRLSHRGGRCSVAGRWLWVISSGRPQKIGARGRRPRAWVAAPLKSLPETGSRRSRQGRSAINAMKFELVDQPKPNLLTVANIRLRTRSTGTVSSTDRVNDNLARSTELKLERAIGMIFTPQCAAKGHTEAGIL